MKRAMIGVLAAGLVLAGCAQAAKRGLEVEDATLGDFIRAVNRDHDFRAAEDIAIHSAIMSRFNACVASANALTAQGKFDESEAKFTQCVDTMKANRTELRIIRLAREIKQGFGQLSAEQLQNAGMDEDIAPLVSAAMKAQPEPQK